MNWLYVVGIILFLLGLMVSIALHELGHLVPAKLFGVKVTQYMVGFGSTAWSRRRGETEYGVTRTASSTARSGGRRSSSWPAARR